MVDVIEPNEGRKHADVGLGQLVASEEPLVFEDRIPVVEGVEQFVDGLVVGALFGRESGPVDPVVDRLVDIGDDLVDLLADRFGREVDVPLGHVAEPSREHPNDFA